MAYKISKSDVWAVGLADKPGTLAKKLRALAEAGANLRFVIARRTDRKGRGVVFVTPLAGAKQTRAAKAAGFKRAASLHSVRVEAPDRRGLGARITTALAASGINLRGISAAAMGGTSVVYLALDSASDANKAMRIIKRL